ncbi:MAG: dehydratase, partial [Actinobacteria bacterium]|nr:dehydratase [Actinomycetota bacterium]
MQVELGKIREFARATQSANPAYLETANPVIPPTFLTTQQFWSTPGSGVFSKIKMDRRR